MRYYVNRDMGDETEEDEEDATTERVFVLEQDDDDVEGHRMHHGHH